MMPQNSQQVKLIDFDNTRNNNFTAIRILFALLVIYGHSYPIEIVPGVSNPINHLFQNSIRISSIAVNGFFLISGFFVTASFVRRGPLNYVISRILRIYPALIICVFISVFVLGPLLTSLDTLEYFSKVETYAYLSNALALCRMEWYLPGVFENFPKQTFNGSLWTITIEARCYVLLLLIGLTGIFRKTLIANLAILFIFTFSLFFYSEIPLVGVRDRWSQMTLYFLIGMLFYSNREKIVLDSRVALLCATLIYFSFGKPWFNYTFPLTFPYLTFWAAYRTVFLNIDKKIGDLSYGIYIYAFPVQKIIAELIPVLKPVGNTIVSSFVAFGIAYVSWHCVESRALSLKNILLKK